ncbi:TetR/AcrR family transcriptional regulator [Pleionea sp. CnH1-48]|uniref:TetR/AcrR family transcriptional regulator n=1 Tax=Pleionea sp. CnH1-48 TaxID=2954494 RepID=UPI002097EF70|nr:hypothetical protein [Pleionea sp. CnH1-48]MCO7227440.1 hypothetical protein [Pleionea sp. CnH1-48]
MSESSLPFTYRGRQPTRIDGIERRKLILEATLRIIVKSGIRGVRHRSVAEEAQVPLAATTYYFKELSDLIHDSFLYFAEDNFASLKALESMSYELLKTHSDNITTDFLVDQLSDYLTQHILNQTKDYDSRLLEHAFKTEALRNEHLAKVVSLSETEQLSIITHFFQQLGYKDAELHAHNIAATILHLEYTLLLNSKQIDLVHSSIRHTLSLILTSKA